MYVRDTDPWSAHVSLLFAEQPLDRRPEAAAAEGFRAVDLWWPEPAPRDAVLAEVDRLGLRLACLNADAGDLAAGERGHLNVPGAQDRAVAAILAAAGVVADLGGGAVNVLVGRQRTGPSLRRQIDLVVGVLREAADALPSGDVVLVVEHLNELDVPGYLAPTPAKAAELVELVDREEVRLLYDAFHASRLGLDPAADAAEVVSLIGHAQYAEAPGRTAPGTGPGDPWRFVEALRDGGYAGAVGLEFEPRGRTSDALAWLDAHRPGDGEHDVI